MDDMAGSEGLAGGGASALTTPVPSMETAEAYQDGEPHKQGLEAVFDVPVRVQAILGRARMPIADLMSMKPGAVVELDRRIGESVDILVNNRLIARGEVVMIDNMLGVTLTEIVRQEG